MGRFESFREDLLVALVDAAETKPDSYLAPKKVAEAANLDYLPGWVRDAVRDWEGQDCLRAVFYKGDGPDSGVEVIVKGAGWEEAEKIRGRRGADRNKSDVASASMGQLFEELKRRNVFHVGIAYVTVGWVLLQVAGALEAAIGLPEWFDGLVFALIAIGFPVALLLAWAYELTLQGLKKTKDMDEGASITLRTKQKLNYLIIGALVVAVGFLLYDRLAPPGLDGANNKCERYLGLSLSEALDFISSGTVKSGYYDGFCIPDPGWSAVARSGVLTDAKTGARFTRLRFQPGDVSGRLYFSGEPPQIGLGSRLVVTGRISRLRASLPGRDPTTGKRIEYPASVNVVGHAQLVRQ